MWLVETTSLPIRLLLLRSGTLTTVLLGFASTGVCNKERPVVAHEQILDFLLGGLVDELLVVSDDTLGDGLSDGVDLRSVTSSLNSNSDVDLGESFSSEKENGFHDLHS